MTVEELIKLITNQLDDALDILDKIFSDSIRYNKLKTDYQQEPVGYSESGLQVKLIQLVKEHRRFISLFLLDYKHSILNKTDDIYALLCKFDFNHQIEIFNKVIQNTSRTLIPFIIRGKENHGQKWLIQKMMNSFEVKSGKPFIFDLNSVMSFDIHEFISQLYTYMNLKPDVYTLDERKSDLSNHLNNRLKGGSQFIIFHNTYSFIHSDKFKELFKALTQFYNAVRSKHSKLIILFVEHVPTSYSIPEFCFNHNYKISDLLIEYDEHFRLIDLSSFKIINENTFENWVAFKKVKEFLKKKFYCHGIEMSKMIKDKRIIFHQKCIETKDNPEKSIEVICDELMGQGYYAKNKELWLKY